MASIALNRIKAKGWVIELPPGVWKTVAILAAVGALWMLWISTARPVEVSVDGIREKVHTHRHTVGGLLLDLGLKLDSSARVSPSPDSPLSKVTAIAIQRARPVQIVTDGRTIQTSGWGKTSRQLLSEAGVAVDKYDQVLLDGQPIALDDPLPAVQTTMARPTYERGHAWAGMQADPLQLQVRRAVPVIVDEGELPFTVRTTAQTVGEALRQAQITIYLGDRVDPSLGSEVVAGLRVTIQRSKPASVHADGDYIKTRTRGQTVADALTQMHIGVTGMDRVNPPMDTKLYDDIKIEITRVREDIKVQEKIAPFQTVFVPDAHLPIDTQSVVAPGAEGITRTRYRVRFENDKVTNRILEDTWVAQDPADRVIAYGQHIESKVFVAPDGTRLTYWRKIRMYASSYSASTAGVSPDKSYFGRTFTGDSMGQGVVAVDPRIIALRSQVYVPGYGAGRALDTGSAIIARRIDLGFDDNNLVLWNKWVDVYLLWPPPPASQITWVLPNWPRLPQ